MILSRSGLAGRWLASIVMIVLAAGIVSPACGTYVLETQRLTDNLAVQTHPSIDGNWVVWEDYRSGKAEIYGYDLATNQSMPIATGGLNKYYPHIDGNIVMWTEQANSNSRYIYAKDLISNQTYTVVSNALYVDEYYSCYDSKIYYSAQIGYYSNQHIYAYDLLTGQRQQISPSDGRNHRFPYADDGYVVWQGNGPPMYVKDVLTGDVTEVNYPGELREPVISGSLVAAQTFDMNGHAIEGYDLLTHAFRRIAGDAYTNYSHPSSDGRFAAWIDGDTIPGTLLGYDLIDEQIFTIIPDPVVLHTQRSMELSGNRVVWARVNDPQFQDMDIYVTTLVPEPGVAAWLGLTALAYGLRRRSGREWPL